jgi:general secretion pathway protein L
MASTLLLRLPAPGSDETEWLLVDESGAPTGPRQRGPLSLAAAAGGAARVVVLAPAPQILLTEPELPPGSGVKLARAVPFALEEQLTEDIDKLYFAIGRRGAGGGTPVAVVSRSLMQDWLTELKAAGIEPMALYADVSLMPDNPAQTVLWLEGDRLAVRRPGMLPFVVELSPVTEALLVAGVIADPSGDATPQALESAILYLTREDWARVRSEFEGLVDRFDAFKVQLLAEGPLPWLARELPATGAVNMLQGEFTTTVDSGGGWRQWRVAALLAVALLITHLGAQALQIHQANAQSAALDGEMSQLFMTAMPSERMSEPRRQMQSRLDRIHKLGSGPQYFLKTLQALGGAVAATPKTSVDSLSFRDQTLDMKLTAPSIDALSQFSQNIVRQGLHADIQSSTPVAAGVEAHMQIRMGGAAKASR